MKILMISHILPWPLHGGCRLRNYNLIKQAAREHELHLVTFYRKAHMDTKEQLADSIAALKQHCAQVHAFPIPGEVSRIKYLATMIGNLFSSEPYSAALYRSKEYEQKVRDMLAEHEYDLIELGEIGMLNYADLAPNIPKLLIHHNVESQLLYRRAEVASNAITKNYIKLQAFRTARFEQKAADTVERHTTCSENDRIVLKKINPNINATVVPNGVDTEYFRSTGEPTEPNSLIFVGGLTWLPNRDAMQFFATEIWPILKREIPDISMTVVGDTPPPEVVELGKRDSNYRVVGFVDDIRPVVTRSAIYVVPIRVGGGTRLKILDSLSMGKAIVSHSIGCEGIEVTHGQNIAIADKAEDIAKEIITLLRDDDRRRELEQNARKLAEEKYDWSMIAPTLMGIYEELAAINRPE